MLIAQISDCHIVEPGDTMADRVDPTPGLERAVQYLNALRDAPELVLGTGDLVNDGTDAQYDQLESILADLAAPFLPLPGNHDDRARLRSRWAQLPPGGPDEPIDHVVEMDGLTLVCLDTHRPGEHAGFLTDDQLVWLDRTLGGTRPTPTLLVQHHPPFVSGIDAMDRYRLDAIDAEVEILGRHGHLVGVVAGHYHRAMWRTLGGIAGFACPSTAVQLQLRLGPGPTTSAQDPPALALHRIEGTTLASHVVQLVDGETWVPSWEREH